MILREFKQGRILAGRLDYGTDLLESLSEICIKSNIKTGEIRAIGAVQNLKCGYYDQKEQKYNYRSEIKSNEPLEITALLGNISLKDDRPSVHLHITAADRQGNCYGGHLLSGVRVFACEYFITELMGECFERSRDEKTQLLLW